ncbi:MAG: efflux RND transporter permease subunit [Gammaproteobacteria bacterium]|nr:efflux RND transporter permease subunit [Gammaproteobacteria bacterium]
MRQRFRSGGLAAWSVNHPVGISMLALSVVVLGFFSLQRLSIDLLPEIIYPDIVVRILEPGVPAKIMEDQVTRQLEEQLAITEGATLVQSRSSEGRSAIDLSFPYGTDIDTALRDASNRLDRARRFLPETIEQPIINKRDPSQRAVMQLIISSSERDPVELRSWADFTFSRWFLNLPGVASVEVGGGLEREVQIIADQEKVASIGLSLSDLAELIERSNTDAPGGRLLGNTQELSTRTRGRFDSIEAIKQLPVWSDTTDRVDRVLHLEDIAAVEDSHVDERIRIRLNTRPGVKVSVQKQPQANTVAVVDELLNRLQVLKDQNVIPADIQVTTVGDQSVYVRHALNNASLAALGGALLAMIVIYLFLGNIVRTIIIGTAIPIGILVTFAIMDLSGLTLNIMTLGGLALGMGLLIDSTIVMLENITRHQDDAGTHADNAVRAATEVNSPIVASTATNLAAILPFLFIGGLIGLLFQELIITITSAMIASLIVALTLVPALGSRVHSKPRIDHYFNKFIQNLKAYYCVLVQALLKRSALIITGFVLLFFLAATVIIDSRPIFLPSMDEGNIIVSVSGDAGISLDQMDATLEQIESMLLQQDEVATIFTTVGGFVWGRSEFQASNWSSLNVQLVPVERRTLNSQDWIDAMRQKIAELELTGYTVRMYVSGVRGIRMSSGDNDLSLRVQGQDLQTLQELGNTIVERLRDLPGLSNLEHTYEEHREELLVDIDRQRAADLGIHIDSIGQALRIALEGSVISDYIEGDRQFDIRLRMPRSDSETPEVLSNLLIGQHGGQPVRLFEVASISRGPAPAWIQRDQQQRIVEITASIDDKVGLDETMQAIHDKLEDLQIPVGYTLYDGGAGNTLKQGQKTSGVLLALAIFLVFVVMAVQYESLRNPLVILFSVPFAAIGVATGLWLFDMPLSMPVWLGLIMLAGIVVNNAIVMVEQIEIEREHKQALIDAISTAASLRLRPILMTTLTTVFGMLPLAIGLGEGSEMLQPLAFVIVWGLSFSMLVSLVLVPVVYKLLHHRRALSLAND